MNETSCVVSSKFLGHDVMGYTSNPNALSSSMLDFQPYHAKLDEVFSHLLCILHIWNFSVVSAT